jgi:hypothetical protein
LILEFFLLLPNEVARIMAVVIGPTGELAPPLQQQPAMLEILPKVVRMEA